MKKTRSIARSAALAALLIALCHFMFAQGRPQPQGQPQPQGKPAAKKSQTGGESCDGALDIVPVKSMSFARKRRPAKPETRPPAEGKADAKPETKADGKPEKQ